MTHRPIASVIAMILILPLLLAQPTSGVHAAANAHTYYVSTNGAGSTCSQANPCQFDTALSKSAAGDTLIIKGGTYSTIMAEIDHGLKIFGSWTGNSSGTVIYDPLASRTVFTTVWHNHRNFFIDYNPASDSDYVWLRDMTISYGKAGSGDPRGGSGGCIYLQGRLYLDNVLLEDCEADNHGGAVYVSGFSFLSVYDSIFDSNSSLAQGGAIYYMGESTGSVRHNSFSNNQANVGSAISTTHGDFDITQNIFNYHSGRSLVALWTMNSNLDMNFSNNILMRVDTTEVVNVGGYTVYMYHNTFHNDDRTILNAHDLANVLFKNNIVSSCGNTSVDLIVKSSDSVISSDTNIFYNNQRPTFVGGHPIYENPKLKSNGHLNAFSPAINAGLSNLGIVNDYDSDLRNAAPDIGADEYYGIIMLPVILR